MDKKNYYSFNHKKIKILKKFQKLEQNKNKKLKIHINKFNKYKKQ
jgi:hypothetical protein